MEIKRINDDLFRHLSYVDVEKCHTTSCPLAGFQFSAAALPFWNRREPLSSPRPSDGEAVEAARRIVTVHEAPKKRPTIDELEAILRAPEARVTINPDGSIGNGASDALTVARALLSKQSEG
jgi:hypothetical protein